MLVALLKNVLSFFKYCKLIWAENLLEIYGVSFYDVENSCLREIFGKQLCLDIIRHIVTTREELVYIRKAVTETTSLI